MNTRGDTVYTFSSIEKEEYSKLYDFLKSKKINVKSTGKMDASKIQLDEDIDHNLAKVKADAESSEDSNSMSSDDEDFNPDELEAKSAKEEYDSDPSDTGGLYDEMLWRKKLRTILCRYLLILFSFFHHTGNFDSLIFFS